MYATSTLRLQRLQAMRKGVELGNTLCLHARFTPVSGLRRTTTRSLYTFLSSNKEGNGNNTSLEGSLSRSIEDTVSTSYSKSPSLTLIVLTTPSHAGEIYPSSTTQSFPPYIKALSKSIEEKSTCKSPDFQVITAIVDALSGSSLAGRRIQGWSAILTDESIDIYNGSDDAGQAFSKEAGWPASRDHASDYSSSRHRDKNAPSIQAQDINDKRGELTFMFPSIGTHPANPIGILGNNTLCKSLNLRMKLANTLFDNGQLATITHHYHQVNAQPPKSSSLTSDLTNLTIRFPSSTTFRPQISLPLLPLTAPRQIHSGNGNIIKELSSSDTASSLSSVPFPASKELEAAVNQWFETHPAVSTSTHQKSQVHIYARITSIEPSQLQDHASIGNGILAKPAEKKEYIRKVLSGGGGWGHRAGLLALDPQGIEGFDIPGIEGGEKGYLEESGNGGRIGGGLVVPGAWVQFFMAVRGMQDAFPASKGWRFEALDFDEYLEFGESVVSGGDNSSEGSENVIVSDVSDASTERGPGLLDEMNGCAAEGGFWINDEKIDAPGTELVLDIDQD